MAAEEEYAINFSEQKMKFCLSLYYNGANSYFFVNGVEIYKFKANDFEINAVALCLGNDPKTFSIDNTIKTELYRHV